MSHGNHNTGAEWAAQCETISAYADDALGRDERVHFERHLSACADCQRELAEYRSMRALLHSLPQPVLPRSFVLPPETWVAAAPGQGLRAQEPSPPRATVPFRERAGRIAQRVGALAAVIGLVLLLGSVLPQLIGPSAGTSTASYGAASSRVSTAPATPARSSSTGSDQSQVSPGTHVSGPSFASSPQATAKAQPSPTPLASVSAPSSSTVEPQSVPAQRTWQTSVPLASAGLLFLGVALLAAGTMASRRRRLPPGG